MAPEIECPGFHPLPSRTVREVCFPSVKLRPLIRLSDNLLPRAFKVMPCILLLDRSIPSQNALPKHRKPFHSRSLLYLSESWPVASIAISHTGLNPETSSCYLAPLPKGVTSLQHIQLPGCIPPPAGLRGLLAVTTTGLAPVSRR